VSTDREEQFRKMAERFPDSPMGHFSLGKYLLDARRYADAVAPLERATRLQPDYAAALVALGEAHIGAGQHDEARAVLERARAAAVAQNHLGLAEEIAARLAAIQS
jgi:cytochrome c-type biogenesis protein CcmH/NrfG